MITTITQGGIGNQMFQYSFGLAQARRLGTELQIDNSRHPLHTARPYNLSLFDIPEKIVDPQMPTHIEKSLAYDEDANNDIVDGDVLFGYFQSEKNFKSIESTIRQRFAPFVNRPERPWTRESLEMLGTLLAAGKRATMVGIRRGDYMKKLNFHGVMPDEYYTEGLNLVTNTLGEDPVLFVFSDEPDWVEHNIEFPYETHVVRGLQTVPGRIGREDIDLCLMAYCNNAIISNSSFHWWGAFLGDRRRNGIVVAPATWFTDPAAQSCAGDIVPSRWMKI